MHVRRRQLSLQRLENVAEKGSGHHGNYSSTYGAGEQLEPTRAPIPYKDDGQHRDYCLSGDCRSSRSTTYFQNLSDRTEQYLVFYVAF